MILLPECPEEEVQRVLGRISRLKEVVYESARIRCGFSHGCTTYRVGETPEEFLKRADEALYAHKRDRKESFFSFLTDRKLPLGPPNVGWADFAGLNPSANLVLALYQAASIGTGCDMAKRDIARHRAKQRDACSNQYRHTRDHYAVNPSSREESLDRNAAVHIGMLEATAFELSYDFGRLSGHLLDNPVSS